MPRLLSNLRRFGYLLLNSALIVIVVELGPEDQLGGEWRDVTEVTNPDEEFQTGDLAGSGGDVPPTSGGIIYRESFFEARLPLIDDHFLAQSLALETGYRYSDYSLGFKTNTYKFGVEYSPISDIRLRGSFQRAVRAPSVTELFCRKSWRLTATPIRAGLRRVNCLCHAGAMPLGQSGRRAWVLPGNAKLGQSVQRFGRG